MRDPFNAVAARLTDVLSRKMEFSLLATAIVRDQREVWLQVVSVAEATTAPVFLYVIEYRENGNEGKRLYLSVGSMLDSRDENNLRQIAAEIEKHFGIVARNFVAVEMQSVLSGVRDRLNALNDRMDAGYCPTDAEIATDLGLSVDDVRSELERRGLEIMQPPGGSVH